MFSVLEYSRENTRQYFILEEIIRSLQTRHKLRNREKYAVFRKKKHLADLGPEKHTLMWLTPRNKTSGQ
jgi:hypothetical protein